MNEPKILTIRPYARLLTMLGEQLIKNERIALMELIKNSYDADASWVKVTFQGFGDNYEIKETSKIIMEDDGCGMNRELIENHWLNPATPEKMKRKQIYNTTPKGLIIQGEKGIGRFAILKLGRKIDLITRPEGDPSEHLVQYDFSQYDDDFLTLQGKETDLFIDGLSVLVQSRTPELNISGNTNFGTRMIPRQPHGTTIEISNLKGRWTDHKVESVYNDLAKLQSIFVQEKERTGDGEQFEVLIYKDDKYENFHESYLVELRRLLDDNSVLKIEDGIFDAEKMEYRFKINGEAQQLSWCAPRIMIHV